jgi:hypothetical protein
MMLKIGEGNDLRDKLVTLHQKDSPRLFEKNKRSREPLILAGLITEETMLGQSSIYHGLSSIHGRSLPLISASKRPPSNSKRRDKLFYGLKSINQERQDENLELFYSSSGKMYDVT